MALSAPPWPRSGYATGNECLVQRDMGSSKYPTADHIHVMCNSVLKLLKDIKINKATGPDAISAWILRDLADEVDPILKFMILQQSLDTGDVPSDWRQANISPIYKKGDWSRLLRYWKNNIRYRYWKNIDNIEYIDICRSIEPGRYHLWIWVFFAVFMTI